MHRITYTAFVAWVATFILASPGFAGQPQELTVSAAISLKNAFEDMGKIFEAKKKGVKVRFNFGTSGDLMRQIEGGAPVDVFAPAAQKEMESLDCKGFVSPGSRTNFASNTLVLIVPADSKATIKSFEDLKREGIKKIAVGNPKTVPAGRYAEEVFAFCKISDAIRDKLIFTENVRQVLDYVARGEVDAGIVYLTDAMIRTKEVRIVATASEVSHETAVYPIAVIRGSKKEAAAKAFILFVLSPEGQKILEKYGFKRLKV